ncbi:MAG: hypothetical protein ACFCD0_15775 [Gemmataceae bacterium]
MPFFPTSGKTWLLSVFSKADLRYDETAGEFAEWYEQSGYQQSVREIQNRLGATNFRHERVEVALTIESFADSHNETIKQNPSGFDIPKLLQSIKRLSSLVEALCNWEIQS